MYDTSNQIDKCLHGHVYDKPMIDRYLIKRFTKLINIFVIYGIIFILGYVGVSMRLHSFTNIKSLTLLILAIPAFVLAMHFSNMREQILERARYSSLTNISILERELKK